MASKFYQVTLKNNTVKYLEEKLEICGSLCDVDIVVTNTASAGTCKQSLKVLINIVYQLAISSQALKL